MTATRKNKHANGVPGVSRRPYLRYRYDYERTSAGALGDHGHELGVDGAEVIVVDVLGDGDAVEAVLPVAHFAVDVSKLGASVGRTP